MLRHLRAALVLVIALLTVGCGGPQTGEFSRPPRAGGPVAFHRIPMDHAQWRIRSNLQIQLEVRQGDQVAPVGAGVDRVFDVMMLTPERPGMARARVDIRSWQDSSPEPGSTPQAGRSYIVERIGSSLQLTPVNGGPISAGERKELERLHRSFGRETDTEVALAGRSLRPGDVVPFVQEHEGAVVEGRIRLVGMTHFAQRPVAEFEFVGKASEVREGLSVVADLHGVLLVDPASSQTLMMDVQGPARARGGAIEAIGASHVIATSTPL